MNVMISSLSKATLTQYSSSFKQWWLYCVSRGIHHTEVTVPNVLDFLNDCFNNFNSQYGTLNNHRSALSLISADNIGQDGRIKRFLKGVFKLRPTFPRYVTTWDPSLVFNYLNNYYPNESLSLEIITKKTVMLLALASGHRCQTLSLIRLPNLRIEDRKIIISITDLVKNSNVGKSQPVLILPYYDQRPSVCPARCLITYMDKTRLLRPNTENKLFLTFKKPHHSATSQTIGRWIKQVLEGSGVDTTTFNAHSTRHAATSAALRAGLSMDVIRNTANWSGQSAVFANFYNRPIANNNNNNIGFVESIFDLS